MFPISFNFPFRKKDGSLTTIGAEISEGGGGGGYTLPTASAETKGGIKIGSGLSMSGEVLNNSNPTPYSLPTASDETLGGIKVGSGLSIDENGVLSASGGGGGSTLYEHNIILSTGISLKIINDSATAYTIATLKNFLYNNGFIAKLNCYPASGGYNGSSVLPVLGIYSDNEYIGVVYATSSGISDVVMNPGLEIDHVREI